MAYNWWKEKRWKEKRWEYYRIRKLEFLNDVDPYLYLARRVFATHLIISKVYPLISKCDCDTGRFKLYIKKGKENIFYYKEGDGWVDIFINFWNYCNKDIGEKAF